MSGLRVLTSQSPAGGRQTSHHPLRCTLRQQPRRSCLKVQAAGSRVRSGKARQPAQYEVKVMTPPPRSLGIHSFEPNMGCGDHLELEGHGTYVVTSVVLQYRLEMGKYVRDHKKLEVQPTGRYFLNQLLDGLYESADSSSIDD